MFKYNLLSLLFTIISSLPCFSGIDSAYNNSVLSDGDMTLSTNDTLKENQVLYNGRIWRNLYYRVRDNQFLFSDEFLPGSVTIGQQTFKNIRVRYDIYSDEIITPGNRGSILQLNKEMVDSFSFIYQNKEWSFIKVPEDSLKGFKGFVSVLYKGKSSLYVKFKKEIQNLAFEGKFDLFYQSHRIFFEKDSAIYLITSRRELFNLLGDYKKEIRNYIKKNKLVISRKIPESFIPVIRFYDTLR